jgi:hypothetical protein
MKKVYFIITFLIVLLYSTGSLYAKITVESTKGEVAYKAGKQWIPLTKGQVLEEGAKISTGMKSWALINIDNSTVRIEQLTMMKIYRNKTSTDTKDTQIGLKHGSLKARVSRLGTLKTSFKITTPVATSSVRGTEEIVSYGSKSGMVIQVLEGVVEGSNSGGVSSLVLRNSVFRLGPNDPRPGNLLADSFSGSLLQIFDPNITEDEREALDFSGGNTTDITGPMGNVLIPRTGGNTPVNINIQWQ